MPQEKAGLVAYGMVSVDSGRVSCDHVARGDSSDGVSCYLVIVLLVGIIQPNLSTRMEIVMNLIILLFVVIQTSLAPNVILW